MEPPSWRLSGLPAHLEFPSTRGANNSLSQPDLPRSILVAETMDRGPPERHAKVKDKTEASIRPGVVSSTRCHFQHHLRLR